VGVEVIPISWIGELAADAVESTKVQNPVRFHGYANAHAESRLGPKG
jgi:hypothetical protein